MSGALSRHELETFQAALDKCPDYRMRRDAIVQWAYSRGGLPLEFWRLHRGYYFGEASLLTTDEVADRLGVERRKAAKWRDEAWQFSEQRLSEQAEAYVQARRVGEAYRRSRRALRLPPS